MIGSNISFLYFTHNRFFEQAESELFNNITRVMARCTIEPALNMDGSQIYPDLDAVRYGGATVLLAPFKIRFIERENRLIV
jgi:hypothetical protein